jgi:hypothetical protein
MTPREQAKDTIARLRYEAKRFRQLAAECRRNRAYWRKKNRILEALKEWDGITDYTRMAEQHEEEIRALKHRWSLR